MEEVKANLYECRHCSGKGTCDNGESNNSCLACAKANELPIWKRSNQKGLLCGSCFGLGMAEPRTEKLNKRIAPLLALFLVPLLILLLLLTSILNSPHFTELLAFSSAIVGSITGFYFSSHKNAT